MKYAILLCLLLSVSNAWLCDETGVEHDEALWRFYGMPRLTYSDSTSNYTIDLCGTGPCGGKICRKKTYGNNNDFVNIGNGDGTVVYSTFGLYEPLLNVGYSSKCPYSVSGAISWVYILCDVNGTNTASVKVDPSYSNECGYEIRINVTYPYCIPNGYPIPSLPTPAPPSPSPSPPLSCGNGIKEIGEECDSNELCCDNRTCTFKPKTTMCRFSQGSCDIVDYCSGYSEICADSKEAPNTMCNIAIVGQCSSYSFCNSSLQCPPLIIRIPDACGVCGGDNSSCSPGGTCGDGFCDATKSENCSNCIIDCGDCNGPTENPMEFCGDGLCDATKLENCSNCIIDCGTCYSPTENPKEFCGDGICDLSENCTTCFLDCGTCNGPTEHPIGFCGDGICNPTNSENCTTCFLDCGVCHTPTESPVVFCGDGICNPTNSENCTTCFLDCGPCNYPTEVPDPSPTPAINITIEGNTTDSLAANSGSNTIPSVLFTVVAIVFGIYVP